MTDYRRFSIPGSTGFFTVNLAQRRGNHRLVDRCETNVSNDALRSSAHPMGLPAPVQPGSEPDRASLGMGERGGSRGDS